MPAGLRTGEALPRGPEGSWTYPRTAGRHPRGASDAGRVGATAWLMVSMEIVEPFALRAAEHASHFHLTTALAVAALHGAPPWADADRGRVFRVYPSRPMPAVGLRRSTEISPVVCDTSPEPSPALLEAGAPATREEDRGAGLIRLGVSGHTCDAAYCIDSSSDRQWRAWGLACCGLIPSRDLGRWMKIAILSPRRHPVRR
jgi:hypothetical protein